LRRWPHHRNAIEAVPRYANQLDAGVGFRDAGGLRQRYAGHEVGDRTFMSLLVRIILGAALLLAAPLIARDHTDLIVMFNGDRITGEIKGLNPGVLRVDLDYVDGAISVQWSKVKHVESTQLFILQAQDGSFYTGTLASTPSGTGTIENR